jgi:predicted nucleic acid-binding protein
MIKRVYLDTSVVGGYFDKEFAESTMPLFENVKAGKTTLIVSDLLVKELEEAPIFVRDFFKKLPQKQIIYIQISEQATELADEYIKAKVAGKTSRADCQHIAMATLSNAEVLVSWNFKHIVNLDRIRGYNSVNVRLGFPTIEIRTPKEII